MSNELKQSLGQDNVISQPQNQVSVNYEVLEAVSNFTNELHQMLQFPPEGMAKIDHIELRLDWKPVLTANLFPQKTLAP